MVKRQNTRHSFPLPARIPSDPDPSALPITPTLAKGTADHYEQHCTKSAHALQKQAIAEADAIRATCVSCGQSATLAEPQINDFFRHPKSHDLTCRFTHKDRNAEQQPGGTTKLRLTASTHIDKASTLRKRARAQRDMVDSVIAACWSVVSHKTPRLDDFYASSLDAPLMCRYVALEYEEATGRIAATSEYHIRAEQLRTYAEVEAQMVDAARKACEWLVESSQHYRLPESGSIFKSAGTGQLMLKYYYEPARVAPSPGLSPLKAASTDHLRRVAFTMEAGLVVEWVRQRQAMEEQKRGPTGSPRQSRSRSRSLSCSSSPLPPKEYPAHVHAGQ